MEKRNAAICMALAAVLALGSVPAYGAEFESIPHTFTAKVGTTEFRKDGEARPLDVAVYIRDGYTMLPLRTFMDAALEQAQMAWDGGKQMATVVSGVHVFTFDVKENTIHRNGKYLPVSGKMEVRDGRIFVPLRNWGNILTEAGYEVAADGITWSNETKTATIHAAEKKLDPEAGLEQPDIRGEGGKADFALKLTGIYDELENIGDGYFITREYKEETEEDGSYRRGYAFSVLDAKTGKTTMSYGEGNRIYELDDGYVLVEARSNGNKVDIIKKADGTSEMHRAPGTVEGMSEGMVLVFDETSGNYGYFALDGSGGRNIEPQYPFAADFSEGLAAVMSEENSRMGYINKQGKMVIDAEYSYVTDFHDGLAKVDGEDGWGYIDKEGNEVIPCRYKWGSDFRNGLAYVTDHEGNTWLINKKGEERKHIGTGLQSTYVNGSKNSFLMTEEVIDLPDGSHRHLTKFYDETEQVSSAYYKLKKGLSEGLAPYQDAETKKYGYVDETGKWIITPVFDGAESFEDGYAIVRQKDSTGYTNWGIIRHPGL